MRIGSLEISWTPKGAGVGPVPSASHVTEPAPPPTEVEERASSAGDIRMATGVRMVSNSGSGMLTMAGTTRDALAVSAVYSCVDILSNQLAALDLTVRRVNREDKGFETLYQHPAYKLLVNTPNRYQNGYQFRQALIAQAVLTGNGLAYIERDGSNRPVAVHVVPAANVQLADGPDGELYYIINRLTPAGANKDIVVYHCSNVIHITALTLDGITGLDILYAHQGTFGLAQAAVMYANKYFSNGGVVSDWVKAKKTLVDKGMQKVQKAIKDTKNTPGATLVLDEDMEYHEMGGKLSEAALEPVRRLSVEDIARIFKVPLMLLAQSAGVTYSNMEQFMLQFAQFTILPWCATIEAELRAKLLTERDLQAGTVKFNFDLDTMLRADTRTRGEMIGNQVRWGVISLNEARIKQGDQPAEGRDIYLDPLNMQQIPVANGVGGTNNE